MSDYPHLASFGRFVGRAAMTLACVVVLTAAFAFWRRYGIMQGWSRWLIPTEFMAGCYAMFVVVRRHPSLVGRD